MPGPRITALLTAFGPEEGSLLADTVSSLLSCGGLNLAIAGDKSAIGWLGQSTKPIEGAKGCFPATLGTLSCATWTFPDDRRPSVSAAKNAAANECLGESDAFLFLRAGDTIKKDAPRKLAEMLFSAHEAGIVFPDVELDTEHGPVRIFAEPFDRFRLVSVPDAWPVYMVKADAIKQVGGLHPGMEPLADYEFQLRLTEKYVALHLPEPIVRITRRPSLPQEARSSCWQRALSFASQRASQ